MDAIFVLDLQPAFVGRLLKLSRPTNTEAWKGKVIILKKCASHEQMTLI